MPIDQPTCEHLELLAPAKNAEFGIAAINHGADAVYIGGPAFGARANAGNALRDIGQLASHAHRYNARVFMALNTILHDSELDEARNMAWQAYEAGVDALIVQDMGLLELDLPPMALHASTQCDIRTVAKASFLGKVGFSQLVLARELSLAEIADMHRATDATLEFFIHGALCVAFSGQCYISHAETGRSANRGDCAQNCRLPYTLKDDRGRVVAFEKHLLSMKDNNQTENLPALIEAGVRSFKIEGRYKDLAYVKNITGHYRRVLDSYLATHDSFRAASSGRTALLFTPNPDKTFHRGTTDYFVTARKDDIGAFDSPAFLGLSIGTVTGIGEGWFEMRASEPLHNGDGLNYLHKREAIGLPINVAERRGEVWRCTPNVPLRELPGLRPGVAINRNGDHEWESTLRRNSAERTVGLDLAFIETDDGYELQLVDEAGVSATVALHADKQLAGQPDKAEATLRAGLGKLGATIYEARRIDLKLRSPRFLPASTVNALRRDGIAALETARASAYQRPGRKAAVEPAALFPGDALSFLANIYNDAARRFYAAHGVKLMDPAFEAHQETGQVPLMVTKHCLRFSFNLCPKQAKGVAGVQGQVRAEPMTLVSGNEQYTLRFDCRPCEMHVLGKIKKHIRLSPSPAATGAHPPGGRPAS